jgi:hypothetical protein
MDASAAMATPCPSCGLAMATMRLERRPHGEASIDACAACRALWFDGFESVQLTPGATLALLKAIHDAEREPVRALRETLACPRCSGRLAITRDLARTTRFTYYRCGRGHGRFTPFVQFLLEKSFVRPLPKARARAAAQRPVGHRALQRLRRRDRSREGRRVPVLPRAGRGARPRRARADGRRAVRGRDPRGTASTRSRWRTR